VVSMATYGVCVKSYKRCRGYDVGRAIRNMTSEQKQHALDLIRDRVAVASLLGQTFDKQLHARVTKSLGA